MSELSLIAVEDIAVPPSTLRGVKEKSEQFLQLKESISDKGLINPISVRPNKNITEEMPQPYFLIDGGHRFRASQLLFEEGDTDFAQIAANIKDVDENESLILQIIGNNHRLKTNKTEYARQLSLILTSNPDLTASALAKRINVTPAWMSQMLSIDSLSEGVKQAIDEGKVTMSSGVALARLEKLGEPTEEWVSKATEMSTGDFLLAANEHMKAVKKEKKTGSAEFEMHAPRPRDKDTIVEAYENTPKGLHRPTLEWILQLDADSVAAERAKYDARQTGKLATKKRNHAVKTAKKLKIEVSKDDSFDAIVALIRAVDPERADSVVNADYVNGEK